MRANSEKNGPLLCVETEVPNRTSEAYLEGKKKPIVYPVSEIELRRMRLIGARIVEEINVNFLDR